MPQRLARNPIVAINAMPCPGTGQAAHLWIAAVLLVAFLACGLYLWRMGHVGVTQIETELANTVAVETWLQAANRSTGRVEDRESQGVWREITGPRSDRADWLAADQSTTVEITNLILEGDLAAVEALLTVRQTGARYRQTRFYRHTDNGWVRTAPQPQLWGQTTYAADRPSALPLPRAR